MIPKSALAFLGFTIWALFQPDRKIARNPSKPPSGYRKEKVKGGLADYVPDSEFDRADLEKGIKVEMEHTNDRAIAKEIAKDHLLEDANYYDKLEKMESGKVCSCGKPYEPKKDKFLKVKKGDLGYGKFDMYNCSKCGSTQALKKKNPAGPCVYEMNVSFKRGRGPLQKRSLLAEAWSPAEAREKFQYQIDRSLKGAMLESLQVRRVTC